MKVSGDPSLATFHREFSSRLFEESGALIKADECYLAAIGAGLLVEMATVEGRLRQSFYILISTRGDETVVRLLPRTSPEKTRAVLRAVAWIASWIVSRSPASAIQSTNVPGAFEPPLPPSAFPG